MKIVLDRNKLERMKYHSQYNKECFTLPFDIEGYQYLMEVTDDLNGFQYFAIGHFAWNQIFVIEYYLNTTPDQYDCIVFDSELISTVNNFT